MPPQFVFEMRDVSKAFGEKVVLRDINLSFFYGAKIGVVGENGAGKSTLLRIMAGHRQGLRRHGHAWPRACASATSPRSRNWTSTRPSAKTC